jgi:hypothetical protein
MGMEWIGIPHTPPFFTNEMENPIGKPEEMIYDWWIVMDFHICIDSLEGI